MNVVSINYIKKIPLSQPHSLLARVRNGTTPEEQDLLTAISNKYELTATLLPIKTVGVQVSIMSFVVLLIHTALLY